LRFSGILTTDR